MDLDERLRAGLVLVLTATSSDGRAVMKALRKAGIPGQLCTVDALSSEVRAGAGAIILAEEVVSATAVRELAKLIGDQPAWSDIPLIILTHPKRDPRAHWRLIQNMAFIQNATFLERPMRVQALLQALRIALRGREQQYRLRDQMREREALLARSEENERGLSAVLNNTRMAVFFMDENQHCTYMNAAAEDLTGYSFAEIQGRTLHDAVHHTRPDGRPYPLEECPIDRALPEKTQTAGEEVFVHKDGHFYPVAFTASPIQQGTAVVGTVLEVRDITERKANTERLHLLLDELNHRVKNTLSTVQSIFLQTLRGEAVSDHAREGVMSRLMALASSHDLLTEKDWVSAPLREVAWRSLAPFGADKDGSGRFTITGEDWELKPKPALAIAMGLHELATNAVKYGALSATGGEVDLAWKVKANDVLQLRWVERGGPPVTPPSRTGFGRRLIERGLAHELAGSARIDFNPDGVVCEIAIPVETALVPKETRITE